MKNLKLVFTSLLIIFSVLSLSAQKQFSAGPDWLRKAVFYQIYPQSFKDSNGDGIGDLNGISERLDYVKALGIDAIWMNPIFDSPFFDAGYDVSDYYKIAPRYGTEQDLKRLISEAHKRDIKIVLDLVAGHSSDQHPWFKASQMKKKNEFTDRYLWTNSTKLKPKNFVSGDFERKGNYLKNFFDCQPALNYGYANPNPKNSWEQPITADGPRKMREELRKIIGYWMNKGIDGFRVDMASSLIKNDTDHSATMDLWAEMRNWFETAYPQGVLIAEWSNPELAIKAGFMIDFMMHFNVPGYPSLFFNKGGAWTRDTCYFDLTGTGSPLEFITNYSKQLNSVGNRGYVSIPTANHDFNRPNCGARDTDDQLKTVLAFLLTIKGIPFIYYGDEIGMRFIENLPNKEGSVLVNYNNANRTGTRTPMQWSNDVNAGFSSASASQLYLPIDPNPLYPNVKAQLTNPASLLNFTKHLVELRKTIPALGNQGDITFLNTKDLIYPLIYTRSDKQDEYLIIINPSGKKVNCVIEKKDIKTIDPLLIEKVACTKDGNKLQIIADRTSYGIFKLTRKE